MKPQRTYTFIATSALSLSLATAALPAMAAEASTPTPQPTSTVATASPQAGAAASAPSISERRAIAGVHTDAISAAIEGGKLNLFSYADLPEGNRTKLNPDEIFFHLPATDQTRVATPAGFDFVAPEGQPIFLAPQTQIPGVVWPGWNTEDIAPGTVKGDNLTFELTNTKAPEGGSVEVFQESLFGVNRVFSSDDPAYSRYTQSTHAHVHSNWAFTAQGVYTLTFKVSGELADGTPVSDTQDYTFVVGDVPGAQPSAPATETAAPTAPEADASAPSTPAPVESSAPQPSAAQPVAPAENPAPAQPAPAAPRTSAAQAPTSQAAQQPDAGTAPAAQHPAPAETPVETAAEPAPVTNEQPVEDVVPVAPAPAYDSTAQDAPAGSAAGAPASTGSSTGTSQGAEKCYAQEEVVGKVAPTVEAQKQNNKPASLDRPLGSFTLHTVAYNSSLSTAQSGHFDFGAVLSGGNLDAQVKDDRTSPARWVQPDTMNFVVGDKAKTKLPAGMENIGPAGSDVYLIGATQQEGVPWLGWNTQNPELIKNAAGKAKMSLKSVDGPGKLSVFLSGNFGTGNTTVFSSDSLGSFDVPMNTHQHGNWVFTAPGYYEVVVGWSVPMKDGTTKSAQGTLKFVVGDGPVDQKKDAAGSANSGKSSGSQGGAQGDQKQSSDAKNQSKDASAGDKPRQSGLDEATGIITKSDGTQVKIVGKTASGADCALSADELKQAQKDSVAGRLAYTGFDSAQVAGVGAGVLILGVLAVVVARRRARF